MSRSFPVLNTTAHSEPRYDRELTVEVWYPATEGTEQGGTYTAVLRDGVQEVTLHGRAAFDAWLERLTAVMREQLGMGAVRYAAQQSWSR